MSSPPADGLDVESYRESVGIDAPDDPAHTELAAALRRACEGEVRFDEYTQILYATDGSIYQARPAGVVFPTDAADAQTAMAVAADHDAPVLPRGAGSSLAGQAVGPGCVVVDFTRHMDAILDVDPETERATVQPGVVQDDLDSRLAEDGLKFAPDPASSNRATVGGGIGNNSTGAHSVRYGITDAYVEAVEAVLADGSRIRAREVEFDGPEYERIVSKDDREAHIYRTVRAIVEGNAEEIAERYPDLKRSVSGYNLHECVYENANGNECVNLAKLFVGAEGTLGVVTEATLSLVSKPDETAVALYCFSDLLSAMEAVPVALDYDPSAVELMDDEVFRLARESAEYAEYADPIPDDAAAALMLEFDSEVHDDLTDAVAETNAEFVRDGEAFDVLEAYDDESQAKLWKLRKAAIPLLMSMEGDPKPYPFIEDASVPPAELAEYVQGFEGVLEAHDTSAAYFAHAGSGTLHVRPVLNLKSEADVEKMQSIAEDVTSLVLDHHGSFSGEHGDGLARTQFNPKMYGPELWDAFKQLKTAFDPDWRMNPGKVVFEEESPTDMRENLRYGPAYSSLEPATEQDFSKEGGFSHLVELCNGCGTCRQTDSDVMCPSYRGMDEEVATTRGRANMLRAAISGELPPEEMHTERFQKEVLDLCLGCKGCQSDCPTGVDLAKLKAEVKHRYHEEEGASLRERLFAEADRLAAVGSALAPVSNWLADLPGTGLVAEKALGVARERDVPAFADQSFEAWFESRGGPRVPESRADDRVLLVPDTYTNYVYPRTGRAAVQVLEAAGVHVRVPDADPSGRPAYSEGFLDVARERAESNVVRFAPRVRDGWSVVYPEPSDAAMVQDEYLDLLPDAEGAAALAENAYGVCEYLDLTGRDEEIEFDAPADRLAYHGHCNQKALGTADHAAAVLDRAGYDVAALDSGCCGMAGSFGYHTEHYDLSQAIADDLRDRISEADADEVVAPGASCRSQLETQRPTHPVEKLAAALPWR
ncbi:FAD-binding and (Fe-S)-binding domain-containing protein [Halorussus sp. MSC15.2]|uniref:FAD-binding and (Fe-S)-binding domain-containing protein n=1 Tax=Halorussus sp. MSC15.2 TaxID=2283638 RepID=UPI0013D5C3E0|nr:FAD-binding and (Fe-S)-binding domain-containing protein [Halorussus sp. MSC15.2]NEU58012.1 FAD-binding protein [Halorussus sp. MSC15.2]